MRIALVTPFDLTRAGGVAEHVIHLGQEFAALGHHVVTLAPKAGPGVARRADAIGVREIGRALTMPTNGSRATLTLDLASYPTVRRVMSTERFDVVHVHAPLTPALSWMAMWATDAPVVATFHAYRERSGWYRALAPVFAPALRRIDARIAVSEPAARFAHTYFPGDYTVIPNGIDLTRFSPPAVPRQRAEHAGPKVLFVGRHDEPRKGLADLLRAWPSVRSAVPGCALAVVGAGSIGQHAGLLDRIGRDGITFVGPVSAAELPAHYAAADLFCAPSTANESFGIVLLEAMASGLPVVASAIPGYASVIANGQDGLLVPPRDPDALASAVVRLLTDHDASRTLGAAGRQTAQGYAWPTVTQRVLRLYERVMERETAE